MVNFREFKGLELPIRDRVKVESEKTEKLSFKLEDDPSEKQKIDQLITEIKEFKKETKKESKQDKVDEENFLKFKFELNSLSSKFENSEDLRAAKISLVTFEDLNSLSKKVLSEKNSQSAKKVIESYIYHLNQSRGSLVNDGIISSPIEQLIQLEENFGSYISDEIKNNFCEANNINFLKKIILGRKIKETALRDYLQKLSDSWANEIGESLDKDEIDKIISLGKNE